MERGPAKPGGHKRVGEKGDIGVTEIREEMDKKIQRMAREIDRLKRRQERTLRALLAIQTMLDAMGDVFELSSSDQIAFSEAHTQMFNCLQVEIARSVLPRAMTPQLCDILAVLLEAGDDY